MTCKPLALLVWLPLGALAACPTGCGSSSGMTEGRASDETSPGDETPQRPEHDGPRGDPSYREALHMLCDAPRLADAPSDASADERMDRAADWLVEHLEDPWAIRFLATVAERPPVERVQLLRREADLEGLDGCALADLIAQQQSARAERGGADGGAADAGASDASDVGNQHPSDAGVVDARPASPPPDAEQRRGRRAP